MTVTTVATYIVQNTHVKRFLREYGPAHDLSHYIAAQQFLRKSPSPEADAFCGPEGNVCQGRGAASLVSCRRSYEHRCLEESQLTEHWPGDSWALVLVAARLESRLQPASAGFQFCWMSSVNG